MSAIVTAQALMHFLWQGALVGIAAWIALSLLERAKASTRYAVALGALLLMAVLPFATAFRLAGDVPRPAQAAVQAAPAAAPIAHAPAGGSATVQTLGQTFGASLLPWIFNLWLAGVAALSIIHLGGFRRVQRLSRQGRPAEDGLQTLTRDLSRRLGVRRAVALLESSSISVPATVGWLRPVVLVPLSTLAGLTPGQLESILAHELAHVRRHDYLVNLLQTAVETLLFYHPAVWWVSAQVRRERENCCDDLAVAVCGDRLSYARALVELEGLRATAPRLAPAASGGSLSGRVRRLLGSSDRPSRRPWAAGLLALALLPAGAMVQTACSGTTARQALHGKESQGIWTWAAQRQGDKLRLTLKIRNAPWRKWTSVDDYPLGDLAGLAPGRDIRFELRRSAGTVRLQGEYDGHRGHGTFTFAGDPAFAQEMGSRSLADPRLLELAVYDIPLSYVQEMRELGYARPTQYRRPRNLHEMLRWHYQDLFGHGHPSSLQQLEEFHTHGVTPEFVRGIQEAGYRDISASDLVELRIHGISPEWLRGMVQAGHGDAAPDQLISMHEHGVNASP